LDLLLFPDPLEKPVSLEFLKEASVNELFRPKVHDATVGLGHLIQHGFERFR
jgi:hypothetical protein